MVCRRYGSYSLVAHNTLQFFAAIRVAHKALKIENNRKIVYSEQSYQSPCKPILAIMTTSTSSFTWKHKKQHSATPRLRDLQAPRMPLKDLLLRGTMESAWNAPLLYHHPDPDATVPHQPDGSIQLARVLREVDDFLNNLHF